MAKGKYLQLRGSEIDNVKWELDPFKIGKHFWLPPTPKKEIELNYNKKINNKAPLRLNPLILDLSRFAPTGIKTNEYGAGEVTLSIPVYIGIEMRLTKQSKEIKVTGTDRPQIVEHTVKIFQKAIKKEFGTEIKIDLDNSLTHTGLGTTPTLMSAIILELNKLCKKPFRNQTLCQIVSKNYAEEIKGHKKLLAPGITTGGAFWSCVKGGFGLVSGNYNQIFRENISLGKLFIGIPPIKEKQSAEKGFEIPIMDLVRKYDRFDAGKICYWTLMRLLPAVKEEDIKKIGEVFWDITINTAKAIPPIIKHGNFDVFDLLAELYLNEIEGAFISSAGPILGSFTKDTQKSQKIRKLYEKYSIRTIETKIDNKGLIIS